MLLYKSTDTERDGYQLDFDVTIPELPSDSKIWLKNALVTIYPDGNKWLDRLAEVTE